MDKKAEIKLVTQSVKGGKLSDRKKFGWMRIILGGRSWDNEDSIIIDAYSGAGDDYQQREEVLIRIESNDEIIFQGTKMEFFHIVHLGVAHYNLVKEKQNEKS